ncbi:response regulator [Roseibacillus persicicus]|uniref:response regulator n=1 Tax=Roseibacillus persicicus TaxID=454148 RepID=UPI00398B17EA
MSDTNALNSKSYYVLFVDDEEKTRKAFTRLFQDEFKILLAGDGAEGFEVFMERQDEIGVIITDQKMPRETGVQFLAKVAAVDEDVVRILSTAYAELDAAVAGVNEGGIYRYVTKPWDVPELEITLRRAMELFSLRKQQASHDSTGSLDVDSVLLNQRVTGLAFSQAAASETDRPHGIRAGAIFLAMLGWQGLGEGGEVDWVARYQTQSNFFRTVFRESAATLESQGTLDWSRPAPPSAAIQAAAIGCDGITLKAGGSDSTVWPGPAPLLAEALRPLMVAFSNMLSQLPGGSCEIRTNFNTVDFHFSGFPLKNGQLILATDPDSTPVLASLLQACLQVEASGGHLSILRSGEGLAIRLGFEENSTEEEVGLAAVKQLTAMGQ